MTQIVLLVPLSWRDVGCSPTIPGTADAPNCHHQGIPAGTGGHIGSHQGEDKVGVANTSSSNTGPSPCSVPVDTTSVDQLKKIVGSSIGTKFVRKW